MEVSAQVVSSMSSVSTTLPPTPTSTTAPHPHLLQLQRGHWPAAGNRTERRIPSHIARFLATARGWVGVYNKGALSVI